MEPENKKNSLNQGEFLFRLGAVLLLSIFLISCGTGAVNDIEMDNIAETVVVVEEPTLTVIKTAEPIEPAHITSGLIFTNADGTWWINLKGELELLIDAEFAKFSPDRGSLAYLKEDPVTYYGDIWIMNITSGERVNITNTPDRDEGYPDWIPDRNDILVFGSDTETGMINASYPTLVGIDGTGYEIMDPEIGGYRGVSPMGEIV